jgi:hypothetical protein
MNRFFFALVCAFLLSFTSMANAAEVTITCVRAVAFRPADLQGNQIKGSAPIVIRAETNARIEVRNEKTISLESYRSKVVAAVDLALSKWRERTNQNVSPLKMIRRVSVTDDSMLWDETHCWSSKNEHAAQYRAIVDGWPKETLPISSLVSLTELAVSQMQAKPVAIEYKFANGDSKQRTWLRVAPLASANLYNVFVTVEYRETTTDASGQVDVSTYEMSEERVGVHASSEDGAYSQVRASIIDRIAQKEEALGRRWHLVNDAKEKRVELVMNRGAK